MLSHCNNDNNNIGNKLEDFTILQVMGKGAYGFVAKVKSKINLQIYALKKTIMKNIDKAKLKELKNEIIFSKYFNHPNVCKCLSSFQEDGCYYIVMHLYNNIDLHKYILGLAYFQLSSPEEKLWKIFIQCLDGLTYIHNMGVIHKDIKIANLFMDESGKIVIGDFGLSGVINKEEASKFTKDEEEIQSLIIDPYGPKGTPFFYAPEIDNMKLDQKCDVYSMGICFFTACFGCLPYPPNGNNISLLENDTNYSFELREIINLMIQINPDNRPTSDEIFKKFKNYYIKKYMKNSGIYSAIRCLFCFPNFENYFKEQKKINQIFDSDYNKIFFLLLIEIGSLLRDKKDIGEKIYNLRKDLSNEGMKIEDYKEIYPPSAIKIILNSLNYELNVVPPKIEKEKYIKEVDEELNEEKKFEKFTKEYNKYFSSLISINFQGVLKRERICNKCQTNDLSFERFHFINFNLNNIGNKNYINIYDLFIDMNKTKINLGIKNYILCKKCNTFTPHTEQKTFYDIKNNLIIMFNRDENNKKIKIDFDETITLNKTHIKKINQQKYELLGIIIEKNNIYYSIIKHKNNYWIKHDDNGENKEVYYHNFNDLKNLGNIICLFYYFDWSKDFFNNIKHEFNNSKKGIPSTNIVIKELKNTQNNISEENKIININQNNGYAPNIIYQNNNMNNFNNKNNYMNQVNNMNINYNMNALNRNFNNNIFDNKMNNMNNNLNNNNMLNNINRYNFNNTNNNKINNFDLNENYNFKALENNIRGNGVNEYIFGVNGNYMNNMNNMNNINNMNNMNIVNNMNNINNMNNMNNMNIMNNINNINNMNNMNNFKKVTNMNIINNINNINNMNNINNINNINNLNNMNNMDNINNMNNMNKMNYMNNNYNMNNLKNIRNMNNMKNIFLQQKKWNINQINSNFKFFN